MPAPYELLAGLDGTLEWQDDFYKDLHPHPELSRQEHATVQRVGARLRQWGYEVRAGIGGTGMVGVVRNGSGPAVMARAELDALPVQEATGLLYASKVTTTDPQGDQVPVMHACGHDIHITALLGAAELLAGRRDAWSGTFVALFQPGEATAAGAKAMIEGGLVDLIPRPDVALAQHVLPLPAGTVGTCAGVSRGKRWPETSIVDSLVAWRPHVRHARTTRPR